LFVLIILSTARPTLQHPGSLVVIIYYDLTSQLMGITSGCGLS